MIWYTIGVAWNWEHDTDFINLLEETITSKGMSLLHITPDILENMMLSLSNNEITFSVFLDRASDSDTKFIPLIRWAEKHTVYYINRHETARQTWDKTTMHQILIGAGLHTPYGIILPSYSDQPNLSPIDLSPLGKSFTIKPAHGGGGEGVVTEATTFEEVLTARKRYPTDKYLIQAQIDPVWLGSHPAWFRVIYCTGKVYPCWWNSCTHVYTPLKKDEEISFCLSPLYSMTETVARISRLDLFSTEIALTSDGTFVVVDFVNDQIDLRLRTKACDGVPDEIVRDITDRLAVLAADNSHYHADFHENFPP